MRGIALLLLALFGSGCTERIEAFERVYDPCASLVLVPSGDMSEGERASVADAVQMWGAVADVGLTTDDSLPEARRLEVEMVQTAAYLGFFDDAAGNIRLARRVDDRHARAVVLAHELGHAFNLFHVPASKRRSVMNEGNWEVEPTAGDAEALARKWGGCVRAGR